MDHEQSAPSPEAPGRPSVLVRPSRPADRPFIFDSWLKDFGERGLLVRGVRPDTYRRCHRLVVERLVERCETRVACDPEAPDVIYGYAVAESSRTLHYIFVKRPFRRLGIGWALVTSLGLPADFSYSHLTHLGQDVVRHAAPGAEYNPWLM